MADLREVGRPLIKHLEKRLGRLAATLDQDPDGEAVPFQIGRFEGTRRYPDVLSFSTLGLSRFPLISRTTGRDLHLELVFSVHDFVGERNIPALVQQVALMMLKSGKALLRGDVIEMEGNVVSDTATTALYASLSAYYDDAFMSCRTEGVDAAVVWLVPLFPDEAAMARQQGWNAFEDLLQEQDPDLCDPTRQSMLQPVSETS